MDKANGNPVRHKAMEKGNGVSDSTCNQQKALKQMDNHSLTSSSGSNTSDVASKEAVEQYLHNVSEDVEKLISAKTDLEHIIETYGQFLEDSTLQSLEMKENQRSCIISEMVDIVNKCQETFPSLEHDTIQQEAQIEKLKNVINRETVAQIDVMNKLLEHLNLSTVPIENVVPEDPEANMARNLYTRGSDDRRVTKDIELLKELNQLMDATTTPTIPKPIRSIDHNWEDLTPPLPIKKAILQNDRFNTTYERICQRYKVALEQYKEVRDVYSTVLANSKIEILERRLKKARKEEERQRGVRDSLMDSFENCFQLIERRESAFQHAQMLESSFDRIHERSVDVRNGLETISGTVVQHDCPICGLEFTGIDDGRGPCILDCGHTFCEECKNELFRRAEEGGGSELCPNCREPHLMKWRYNKGLNPN